MPDKLVEVAAYSIPVEAHAARGLLEAEGIRAVLEGEGAVNVFSGVQGLGGKITLNVAESDAERAVALLADVVEGPPPDDSRLWLCPLCGDAVDVDRPVCPACQTPRPDTWQVRSAMSSSPFKSGSDDIQTEPPPNRSTVTSDTPIEAVPWAREEEEDRPAPETSISDDLVRRAFRSALFGLLFFPLTFYAVWLLWRLVGCAGKISPQLMPRLYAAIAMVAPLCLACLLIVMVVLRLLLFYR